MYYLQICSIPTFLIGIWQKCGRGNDNRKWFTINLKLAWTNEWRTSWLSSWLLLFEKCLFRIKPKCGSFEWLVPTDRNGGQKEIVNMLTTEALEVLRCFLPNQSNFKFHLANYAESNSRAKFVGNKTKEQISKRLL